MIGVASRRSNLFTCLVYPSLLEVGFAKKHRVVIDDDPSSPLDHTSQQQVVRVHKRMTFLVQISKAPQG